MPEYFNLAPPRSPRRPAAKKIVSPPNTLHHRPKYFSLTSLAAVRRVQTTAETSAASSAQPQHSRGCRTPGAPRLCHSLITDTRPGIQTVPLPRGQPQFSPPLPHQGEAQGSRTATPLTLTPPDTARSSLTIPMPSDAVCAEARTPPPPPLMQTKVVVRRPPDKGSSIRSAAGCQDTSLLARVGSVPSACRGDHRDPSSGQAFCWGDPSAVQGRIIERSLSSSSGFSGFAGSLEGDETCVPTSWVDTLREPGSNTPGSPRPWRPELTVPAAPELMTARRRNAMRRSLSEPLKEFLSFREQADRLGYGSKGSPTLLTRELTRDPAPASPVASALQTVSTSASRKAASPVRGTSASRKAPSPGRGLTVPQAPALATEGRSWVRGLHAASPKPTPKPSPRYSPRAFPSSSPRASPRSSPRVAAPRLTQAETPKSRTAAFAFRAQVGERQPWQASVSNACLGKRLRH